MRAFISAKNKTKLRKSAQTFRLPRNSIYLFVTVRLVCVLFVLFYLHSEYESVTSLSASLLWRHFIARLSFVAVHNNIIKDSQAERVVSVCVCVYEVQNALHTRLPPQKYKTQNFKMKMR